ncbi:hypothetical protein ACNOYE_37345 [Nannocystaceae bacterium ST9]
MRHFATLVGITLILGCGDNPPKSEGDDEAAEAEGTAAAESGDAQVDESAGESTTKVGSDATDTEPTGTTDAETASTTDAETTVSTTDETTASTSDTSDTTDTTDTTDTSGDTIGHTTTHGDDHGDTTTGGEPDPVAYCVDACVDASQCASPLPAFDEDNWTCIDAGCQWLGCKDGECDPGHVCHDSGVGVPSCMPECMAAADCDQGYAPYIESNYSCDAGACVFLGCAADSECSNLGPGYVCTPAMDPPTCVASCASPQDCASPLPAYNVDNWSCDAGACVWLGCKAGECGKTKTCALLQP